MANPNPEQIPVELEKLFREAEQRIMEDVVYRIRVNGFPGATGNWEISRLQQLGESEQTVRQILGELLQASEEEIDRIFSDDVYAAYYGMAPAYSLVGMKQIPYKDNIPLQQLVESVKRQTDNTITNITKTTGFVRATPGTGQMVYENMSEFYRHTLDSAMIDLSTGAMSYTQVLNRAINTMTTSGVRSVSYESGRTMRIDAAARMCVHTGFRQVMSHINEQTAKDIGTDYYEVPWHAGARPTHQAWQGKVYSHDDLVQVCGLGEATGLCGINCYHDYYPFIPGVSTRTYTDEWLEEQNRLENTKKEYAGKEYTTYEALQEQRKQERVMRKTRESIDLLKQGDADKDTITNMQAKYKGQMSAYKEFSKKMELPEQLDRVFQDQRGNVMKEKRKGLASASRIYVNKNDKLFENAKKVKPIEGFEDFTSHATPDIMKYDTTNGVEKHFTAKDFADMLREDPSYKDGNVRLLFCEAGKKDDGFAKQLADELNVLVLAPTEKLWIDEKGNTFITDSATLAEMWYDGIDVKQTGYFRLFKPKE